MLDSSFWDLDYTPVLDERVENRLFLVVILRRPDRQDWPDFWKPEHVWHLSDLAEIRVCHDGRDKWKTPTCHWLVEVTPFYFGKGLDDHLVHGAWGPYGMTSKEVERPVNDTHLSRCTSVTEDDLVWLFSNWNPDQRSDFPTWWKQAQVQLPKRNLHPDDYAMVERAARKVLNAAA